MIQAASTCFPLDIKIPALQANIANVKHNLGTTERLEKFKAVADKLQAEHAKEDGGDLLSHSGDLYEALKEARGINEEGCSSIVGHKGVEVWVDTAMDQVLEALPKGKEDIDVLTTTFDAFKGLSEFCEKHNKPIFALIGMIDALRTLVGFMDACTDYVDKEDAELAPETNFKFMTEMSKAHRGDK